MEKDTEYPSKNPRLNYEFDRHSDGMDLRSRDEASKLTSENRSKTQVFSSDLKPQSPADSDVRSKTSLRMVYEAQASVIQTQIGDLETVRLKLGLSARKICQLLMVDPSAWNRWTRFDGKAPPHVWRSLQWYLALQEKLPGLTPQYFVERVVARGDSKALESVGQLSREFETKMMEQAELLTRQAAQIQSLKKGLWILGSALGGLVFVLFLSLLFKS